ncbi:unnamed protein product [Rotaria magnacalcarata]|uniref:NAD(P)(+)--arginine ADP-ribosyltransferase n=1 Tax=Rotaria magnacalcarata TaxID=392030 RepID=A0A820CBR3_9BILA|nr:unnamed protein product [Rotaria magnacalcarata]
MQTPFHSRLNEALRAENQHKLKPWFGFLKLFMAALEKLPSVKATVWRGVLGNVTSDFKDNNLRRWWSINSCSTKLDVVACYIHNEGTVFAINALQCKDISTFSAFPDENEVILMPGTALRSSDLLNILTGYLIFILLAVVHLSVLFFLSAQAHERTLQIERDTHVFNGTQYKMLYVPLMRVSIETTIHSFIADVNITWSFYNAENVSIEAVYCFPMEERAAVYSFVARINDREVTAHLKEKNEAQHEYGEALRQGHGAYLLELDEQSIDNLVINVGAIPPLTECTITILYVTELERIDGSTVELAIPTTIAPRYNSKKHRITSPAGTTSKYVQQSPYTMKFCGHIKKKTETGERFISKVSSTSHPIEVDLFQQDAYVVTFSQENIHLDRDILIDIELIKKQINNLLVTERGTVMAVLATTGEDCPGTRNNSPINEFIFVLDCSDSMSGHSKIELAKQTIMLFLKSLPIGSYFNIIRFGSNYTTLFPETVAMYAEVNILQAKHLIVKMQADLGGAELRGPLQWLTERPPGQGHSRQIILLTDGEISDVLEVLNLCQSIGSSSRIYPFGFGSSPSRALIKGLARVTDGQYAFIPPNTKIDIRVKQQLFQILQKSLSNVQVRWNLSVGNAHITPIQSLTVYANGHFLVYGLINDTSLKFNLNSSVQLYTECDCYPSCEAKVDRIVNISENRSIAEVAAKIIILKLEYSKKTIMGTLQRRLLREKFLNIETNKAISELSLKHNILSSQTAFFGEEKRATGKNIDMVLCEVPIQIPKYDLFLTQAPSSRIGMGTDEKIKYSVYNSCAERKIFGHWALSLFFAVLSL